MSGQGKGTGCNAAPCRRDAQHPGAAPLQPQKAAPGLHPSFFWHNVLCMALLPRDIYAEAIRVANKTQM